MPSDLIDHILTDWSGERPDLDRGPMEIALRIQTLAKVLADQTSIELEQVGLEWYEYDVLSTLRRQGKPYQMTASAIAESTQLTSGAMTNRIDNLEERGLVQRLADPSDRRRVVVELTREGITLVNKATDARFLAAKKSMTGLSKAQVAQLADILRNLILAQDRAVS